MLRPIVASLAALALLPAAADAATVRADRAAAGACTPSAGHAATTRLVPDADGVATVRIAAARGDWDLVVLDAATGERVAAAASSAGDEWTYALVRDGRALTAVACRRPGASRTAAVSLRTWAMPAAERVPAALVEVPVADEIAMRRLEATGLDVTHNHDHDAGTADVVVYGPGDRLALLRAGFPVTRTLIADLRLNDLRQLREDARATGRSALPSGRTTYRTLADYDADLKKLVADHPAIARSVTIGKTFEGRNIDGVELAARVTDEGDGRPTFLVVGGHHAREWPSGEMPMEFAIDMAKRHAAGDPRVRELLDRVRILAVPIINRDGFEVSRTAGGLGPVDDTAAPLPLSLTDTAAYKRKNCRPTVAQAQATPCITRPAIQGVDLNRNYGQFFGGVGSEGTNPAAQNFRGAGPYSEPESDAVRRLSSTRTIPVLVSHHTFTAEGTWLRQPGFCQRSPCSAERDVVEDEAPMAALGDGMGEASGWQSQLGWAIGQITGATEDWNYFTQGTLGYTPEQRAANFHPTYATAVVREYDGTGPGARGGVAESLLRAAETAADPASHAVLDVAAPAGRTLRLTKAFKTPTSISGLQVDDQLDFRATVPKDGKLEWHVNQSSRPSCDGLPNCAVPKGTVESYTLECLRDDKVVERRSITIARGERQRLGVGC